MKKRALLLLFSLLLLAFFVSCASDRYMAVGIENYDLAAIVDRYAGDLDSGLAIFPAKETLARAETTYRAALQSGLFDTDGEIFLDCVYADEADYLGEVERLSGLSVTIRNTGGKESVKNEVLYDETSYPYPAYITIDGFGSTYEYALLIPLRQEIVYLYLAYPNEAQFDRYGEYLKRDRSVYKQDSEDFFSMYNHSFDGGKSYVEFDD